MQKKFKRLIIRIAKKRVFKEKIIEASIFVNFFVSFFFTQSAQFSTNVSVFTKSAFFFSEKSVQFYNSSYSSFSFVFEIVSRQSAFAQFQNQFSSVSQFIRNQQNAITIEQASSQMYSQFSTQAMKVNSQKSQNTALKETQMLSVKTQFDAQIKFLDTLINMKKIYEISDSVVYKEMQIDLSKNVN